MNLCVFSLACYNDSSSRSIQIHSILLFLRLARNELAPRTLTFRLHLHKTAAQNCRIILVLLKHNALLKLARRPRDEIFRPDRRFFLFEGVGVTRAHEGEPIGDQLFCKCGLDWSHRCECPGSIEPCIDPVEHHPVFCCMSSETGHPKSRIRLVISIGPRLGCTSECSTHNFALVDGYYNELYFECWRYIPHI